MLRVNIIDRRNNLKCECYFDENLSLSENIALYDDLKQFKRILNYVYPKESNQALNLNVRLKDFNFVDGQILIFY